MQLRLAIPRTWPLLLSALVCFPWQSLAVVVTDQSNTNTANDANAMYNCCFIVAQTYTAGLTGNLTGVSLDISSGSNLQLHVAIRTVANGEPTTTVLGETTLATSHTTLADIIAFPKPIPQVAGTQYAIVVDHGTGAPPATIIANWGATLPGTYAAGRLLGFNGQVWYFPATGQELDGRFITDVNVPACVTPPSSLSAWWPLDPAAGGKQTVDLVNNVNATVNGAALFGPGEVGQALTFDGSTVFVSAPNSPSIDIGTGDFSIDFWMRIDDPTVITGRGARVILDKRNDTNGYHIFLSNGRFGIQLADGTLDNNYQPTTPSPLDKLWHFYAVTVQRSSPTGIQFYVDGQLVSGTGDPTPHPKSLSNTTSLQLGQATTGGSSNFKGSLDEFELFKKALSAAEVLSLYNAGTTGKCRAGAPSSLLITSVFFPAAAEGSPYTFTFTASGGQPPYQWSATGLPSWLTLSTAGVLSGTPPKGSAGNVGFTVTVTDAVKNFISAPLTIRVNPATPISIAPAQLSPATEGTRYSVTFTASGGAGTYTWSASGLPVWLTLSTSGNLSGTPPAGSAGAYNFSVTVNDVTGAGATQAFTLTVNPLPLVITTASPLPLATENTPYRTQLTAIGGKTPYQWSGSGLASWLSLDAAGVLNGTPPPRSAGAIAFTATVTDGLGTKQVAAFTLPIAAASGALTIITASPLAPAATGTFYSQKLSATGGRPPYTWDEGNPPAGLRISSSGILSGTPTSFGDSPFTARVSDSAGAVTFKLFALTIVPPQFSIATPSPLADGVTGIPYSQTFDATGGKQPIRWASSSALPAGLTLSSGGTLAGTPGGTGAFLITVSATDADDQTTTSPFRIAINPPGSDLVLSAGSLAFTAVASGNNPPPRSIAVISSGAAALPSTSNGLSAIPFTASADASWLSLTPNSGTTPGSIDVNVNQGTMPAGKYTATITVASPGRQPKTVLVSLTLNAAPASLAVSPSELRLSGKPSTVPLSSFLQLVNTGSGPVSFSAAAINLPGATLTPASGTVLPNSTVAVRLSINTQSLAGFYRGRIEINFAGGSASTLVLLQVDARPKLVLSSNGVTINATQGVGVAGFATRSFTLLGSDSSAIAYHAEVIGSAPWLTLITTGGSASSSSPSAVSFTVDSTRLAPGAYYARIRITAPGALLPVQDFVVVLNVNAPGTPVPSPSPAGLLFVSNGSAPPSQTFQVFTNTVNAVPFQTGVSTQDGGTWLTAQTQAATVSGRAPVSVLVSVNPAGLKRGVYRGKVSISEGTPDVRSVGITLVVASGSATDNSTAAAPVANCTPTSLALVQSTIEGNFSVFAGWPGLITAMVVDDCGNTISNASVTANFSNGDPTVTLELANPSSGTYAHDWYPNHTTSQLIVTINATAPGADPSSDPLRLDPPVQIGGGANPNAVPMLRGDGPLHIFNPQTGAALAPGTIFQIYGSGLGSGPAIIDIDGRIAPILFRGDSQINAQVPFDLNAGPHRLIAGIGAAITDVRVFQTADLAPGMAALPDGAVVAQHQDFSYIRRDSPAIPGEYVILYLAGMGPTNPPVVEGAVSPSSPLATFDGLVPVRTVKVQIDYPATGYSSGQFDVAFAGLSPGSIGLYQINFLLPPPPNAPPQGDVQIKVIQNGVVTNTTLLPVAAPVP